MLSEEEKKARDRENQRKWREAPENRERQRERDRKRFEDPEYRERKREQSRQWREAPENRERQREQSRQWREDPENRERQRDLKLQRNFGITREQFREMLASQNHKCAACPQELQEDVPLTDARVANVDHCHNTGRVRAILCRRCNTAFGVLEAMTLEQHNYLMFYQLRNDHLDDLVQ